MSEFRGFDARPSRSRLSIGLEVEYPISQSWEDKYIKRGMQSSGLRSRIDELPLPGRAIRDGTVGLEVVSPVLDLGDAKGWYADVIEHIESEYEAPHAPTGLIPGSTAGLHIHLSSLSREQAEKLSEISHTPWGKAMFCTSIASDEDGNNWSVFRGESYCRMGRGVDGQHYTCVNSRGDGHYEWRLPEPMDPDHVGLLAKFLRIFEQDMEASIQYVQERLDDADERITSLKRAEAVGIDIEAVPTVARSPSETSTTAEEFYNHITTEWGLPEIYRVQYDGSDYYVFETELQGEFETDFTTFSHDDVLRAGNLEPVQDDQLREDINRAFTRAMNDTGIQQTEATDFVKNIIKKKKGK